MTNKAKKNEGPACACGRGDLYDEWLKQNEKVKEEAPTDTRQVDSDNSSVDSSDNGVQKP